MLRCLVSWCMRPRILISWYLMIGSLIPWSLELGRRSSASFLTLAFWAFRREHWRRTCPLRPQWWHMGGLLMELGFWVPGTSSLTLSFPLSSTVGGGSGTVGFTNTVFEVEEASEEGDTYPRPALSVGLFWIDSIRVSFSSVTLSS
jgi:hypothetical protein